MTGTWYTPTPPVVDHTQHQLAKHLDGHVADLQGAARLLAQHAANIGDQQGSETAVEVMRTAIALRNLAAALRHDDEAASWIAVRGLS